MLNNERIKVDRSKNKGFRIEIEHKIQLKDFL